MTINFAKSRMKEKVWRGHHPDSMVAKFCTRLSQYRSESWKYGLLSGRGELLWLCIGGLDDNGRVWRCWLGQSCPHNCGTSPIKSCNRADSHLFITLTTTASPDGWGGEVRQCENTAPGSDKSWKSKAKKIRKVQIGERCQRQKGKEDKTRSGRQSSNLVHL